MRLLLLIPVFFIAFTSADAQIVFQRSYGTDTSNYANSATQTADGGYIFATQVPGTGVLNWDIALVKTDSIGDTVWIKTYDDTTGEACHSIRQNSDGGYIIGGSHLNNGGDVYLIRTDPSGIVLWANTYGGNDTESGWTAGETSDNGFFIAGTTESFGTGNYNFYLARTDANGNLLWDRSYGGGASEVCRFAKHTQDNGFILSGVTTGFGAGWFDMYVVKADSLGNVEWSRTYGDTNHEYSYGIDQCFDGGYIITGYTGSYGVGGQDILLVRTDALGDTLWTRTYGTPNDDWANAVVQTSDSGFIVTGCSTDPFQRGFLIKTNAAGDTLWTREYGDGRGRALEQTTDSGFLVAGLTYGQGPGYPAAYLIKTDSEGNTGGCNQFATNMVTGRTNLEVGSGVIQYTGGAAISTSPSVGSVILLDTIICMGCPQPTAKATGTATICEGVTVNLSVSGNGNYLWSTSETDSSINVTPTNTATYMVSVTNVCGTVTDSVVINVLPAPIADAGEDTTIFFGQSVQLYGVQGASYLWSPATGLSCTNCPDPIAGPETTTTYYLTVTGANGCINKDTITVFIDATHSLYIPNIFSPNGDGSNDVLYVRGKGIESVHLAIYDRWGEMVFESSDINTGWDGVYQSRQVNNGVFVYRTTGTYTDDTPFDVKGNVTLVR